MLDSRPRISSSRIIYVPLSFDGVLVNCMTVVGSVYHANMKMTYKDFYNMPTLVRYKDKKITIDNVELHVYHTGMGYVVYNETYAVLVTHIREVRQYDIQGGGV